MKIFKKIRKSFFYAWSGFSFFTRERNIKIHLFAAMAVIIFGIAFNISLSEWIAIVFCITLVISMEIVNTVLEEFVDFFHPGKNGNIMIIKDLAAAAVLVSAFGSLIIGAIIFIPYFVRWLQI